MAHPDPGAEQDGAAASGAARARALAPYDERLHLPPRRAGTVHRARALGLLAQGPPVVLLSAPAGYGKTTLIAEQAELDPRPVAYVSLTARENDPTVLVAYLARALASTGLVSDAAIAALCAPGADPSTALAPVLAATLRACPPVVLALDDVHVLTARPAIRILEVLVDSVPPPSTVVLAARHDPELRLGRLQTQGRLTRLGPDELRLDEREAQALLGATGVQLAADAAAIVARAEGWPAGLYLAALSARGDPEARGGLRAGPAGEDLAGRLVREEYLAVLPDDVVAFLTRTAVLDRLTASLCDAVLERSDSVRVLRDLERSNLFLVPLDRDAGAFRYHHLFGSLLRAELRRREPALESTLHRRAAAWYTEQGDLDRAIDHAIAAGDQEQAEALLWSHALPLLSSGRGATLDGWLEHWTAEQRAASPVLTLVTAWRCVTGRDPHQVDQWTAAAERHRYDGPLPDGTDPSGVVATLLAMVGRHGLEPTRADAARAVELDTTGSRWLLPGRLLAAVMLRLAGELDAARDGFEDVARRAVVMPVIHSLSLTQLAMTEIADDRWTEARRYVEHARGVVHRYGLVEQPPQSSVYAASALLHARDGDRERALADWQQARHLVGGLTVMLPWLALEVRVLLARAAALLGDLPAALLLAREARTMLVTRPGWEALEPAVASVQAAAPSASTPSGPAVPTLTTAEVRVLRYLPTHLSLAAIAADLFVSRNTVKTQAIAIYRKLGVTTRQAAVEEARRLGLLPDLDADAAATTSRVG